MRAACLVLVTATVLSGHMNNIFALESTTSFPSSVRCKDPDPPLHGSVSQFFYPIQKAHYKCNQGFHLVGLPKQVCDSLGRWSPIDPPRCFVSDSEVICPVLSQPDRIIVDDGRDIGIPGSKATLICGNSRNIQLICSHSGNWVDADRFQPMPSCHKFFMQTCAPPSEIAHGYRISSISYFKDFTHRFYVGSRVEYKCYAGYRLLGPSFLECLSNNIWSDAAPYCLNNTEDCGEPPELKNGVYYCMFNKDYNSNCFPSEEGMKVYYSCNKGYVLSGVNTLTCVNKGWDFSVPTCRLREDDIASDTTDIDNSSHGISPLGIVIATACSVLGVLLLVMVVMVFRRRKPRPRLLTSSQAPPPYSRVHSNSIDEHDQVFLIGYDGSRPPTLPTYEEAVSQNVMPGHHQRLRRSSGGQQEYRPLPSIPTTLRNNMHHFSPDNNNRLSSVTAGSITRDGISEAFGSIDTVNVSISDASTCTSVTVETYESGSSHPSNTSGRATAGSLGSLSGNLITDTEDVPLLENASQDEEGESGDEGVKEAEEVKEN
ncbi:hypothetical protein ScPMuIL_013891 [Solemya velum]